MATMVIADLGIRSRQVKVQDLQHFHVSQAYICVDCDHVGNSANQCPSCASESLVSVSAVVNR